MGGWVALMVFVACYLVVGGLGADPDDPGLADVAFFLSPVIAFAAAFSTTFLLAVAEGLKAVDLGQNAGKLVYGHGIWLSPVLYLVLLFAGAGLFDDLHSTLVYGVVMFLVPVLLGAGSVLLLAIPVRR